MKEQLDCIIDNVKSLNCQNQPNKRLCREIMDTCEIFILASLYGEENKPRSKDYVTIKEIQHLYADLINKKSKKKVPVQASYKL